MEVKFNNKVGQKVHKCHVCENCDFWNNDWQWRYVSFGSGYKGYENEFKTCSNKCRELIKDCTNKQLQKLYNKNK